MSLVTFNDDAKTIYECVPVNEVVELTAETYQPDCCTALYDVMGGVECASQEGCRG